MKWNPGHDRAQQETAGALTRHHAPHWWVMWSYSLRAWVAFYLGSATVTPLRYTDPDELSQHMRHVAHRVAAGRTP
ncbi:hypothetical protein Q8791_17155 [Nocardiopsis sp. CT-R113]|uniref:Uncharacterized protein n=1 Tax=Nocardiopsis codii TaxID=3065942 RepID=A0ABU7K9M2_9ACTN|nr:hypothetical protein [Nocardiopsis sp. CT-R113]MEE2038949.1 hypothetical protein [Nocardiopsis sp. CT-R113]